MSVTSSSFKDTPPAALHYSGEAAEAEFQRLLARAYSDDATGGVFGYRWEILGHTPGAQLMEPTLTRLGPLSELKPFMFSMVVIDSGNSSGDAWKYVYHPGIKSGTFIPEN